MNAYVLNEIESISFIHKEPVNGEEQVPRVFIPLDMSLAQYLRDHWECVREVGDAAQCADFAGDILLPFIAHYKKERGGVGKLSDASVLLREFGFKWDFRQEVLRYLENDENSWAGELMKRFTCVG